MKRVLLVAAFLIGALTALCCYDRMHPPNWPGDPTAPEQPFSHGRHADGGNQ